jgi:hypothetical protein
MKGIGERKEGRRSCSETDRRGLTPMMAGIVLAGFVVMVGVVGFVVLNAVSHSSSSTVQSCAPSTAPQCAEQGNTTGASYGPEITVNLFSR